MRYKSEGVAQGLSLQAYCSAHNILVQSLREISQAETSFLNGTQNRGDRTEFMTREQVIDILKRVCEAYDRKTLDAIEAQVHHEHTARNLQRELNLKDEKIARVESDNSALERSLANKYADLLEKDSKIRDLEKQMEASRHSEVILKVEKFAGKSKRGIEKSKSTAGNTAD